MRSIDLKFVGLLLLVAVASATASDVQKSSSQPLFESSPGKAISDGKDFDVTTGREKTEPQRMNSTTPLPASYPNTARQPERPGFWEFYGIDPAIFYALDSDFWLSIGTLLTVGVIATVWLRRRMRRLFPSSHRGASRANTSF